MKKHLLTSFSALTSGLEVVETKEEAEEADSTLVVSGFSNSSYFGLLALRPEDGAELWRQELEAKPLKHDCNLVDVNNDGLKDCIVVGERGMLAAIDPQTGKMHFPFNILFQVFSSILFDWNRQNYLESAVSYAFGEYQFTTSTSGFGWRQRVGIGVLVCGDFPVGNWRQSRSPAYQFHLDFWR